VPARGFALRRCCLVVGPLFAALLDSGAIAQSLRWTRDGTTASAHFGASLAWLPDRDGDGVDEIVAGAPGEERVRVLSGRSLATLLEIAGPAGTEFGAAVAVVGDLDGDGAPEVAIGAPLADDGTGRVELRSSLDGTLLRTLYGDGSAAGFGRSLVDLGDIDGDGSPELAVGTALPSGESVGWNPIFLGTIAIVATSDGRVLARRHGWSGDSQYGNRLATLRDLDGDGRRDVATIAWQADSSHVRHDFTRPTLELLSGATLAPLRIVDLLPLGEQTSQSLLRCAALGDADGDGLDDIAVADAGPVPDDHDPGPYDSRAWAVSGATGHVLREWRSGGAPMGEGLCAAGDVDADGCDDLAITDHVGVPAHQHRRSIALYSVRTGALLRRLDPGNEIAPPAHSQFGAAMVGARDLDRDAVPDLVVGAPEAAYADPSRRGRVLTFSTRRAKLLAVRWGEDVHLPLASGSTRFGDVEGDGFADVAASERWAAGDAGSVALLSGRDGALLRRLAPAVDDGEYGAALAPLPDLDGDGVGELAIGARQRIEVRSGTSGALLQELDEGLDPGAVLALAAGVQPDGHVHLIVGQPWYDGPTKRIEHGLVAIYDLADGSLLHHRRGSDPDEQLGSVVAFLGDVTNDTIGDWAAGAPGYSGVAFLAGRVAVIEGANGKVVKQLLGTAMQQQFGAALAGVGDVTGDGFGDLLVGSPTSGAASEGRITLFKGRAWSVEYERVGTPYAFLGGTLERIGDVNGDGSPEFATVVSNTRWGRQIELRSAASGRLLVTLDGRDGIGEFERTFAGSLGRESPWLAAATHPPTLLAGTTDHRDRENPHVLGQLLAFDLPSLFLEVAPRHAPAGASVRGDVRGAPAAAFVGILVVEIDSVPFEEFISLGVTDVFGDYLDWSIVPPGLSGTSWKLRAYADGFDGHTAASSDVTLTFE